MFLNCLQRISSTIFQLILPRYDVGKVQIVLELDSVCVTVKVFLRAVTHSVAHGPSSVIWVTIDDTIYG